MEEYFVIFLIALCLFYFFYFIFFSIEKLKDVLSFSINFYYSPHYFNYSFLF